MRKRIAFTLFIVFSSLGALQIVAATKSQLATVRRDLVASSELSAPSAGFENYLPGSSGANFSRNSPSVCVRSKRYG